MKSNQTTSLGLGRGFVVFAQALLFSTPALVAADITWRPPTPISTGPGNSSDVSINGTLIEATNCLPSDTAITSPVVNGVTFAGTDEFLPGSLNGGAADKSLGTNGGDAAYDALLSNLDFGGGGSLFTISVGGGALEVGKDYEIQVWFVDDRSATDGRVMRFGDGNGNTADLNDEFALGTFVADDISQDLSLEAQGFGNAHITAYQIREIAPNPIAILSGLEEVSGAFAVDVLFSKEVSGLTATDFSVSNGTAGVVTPAVGPSNSYSVSVTPLAAGYVTIDLPAGSVEDANSNQSLASNQLKVLHIPLGSEQAMVTLSTTAVEPVAEAYIVDVVFDEDVSGLEVSDFEVVGGTASDLLPSTGPASTYTVLITPTVDGNVSVSLPDGAAEDVDDGLPSLASNVLLTDYLEPVPPLVDLYNPLDGSVVSGPYTVDVFFSEDVSGMELSDFLVTNGTLSNLVTLDPATYQIDVTPTENGLVILQLPEDSVVSLDTSLGNESSAFLYTNFLPAGTWTSGLIDLSGRDVFGLGDGESNQYFTSPKTFDPISDLSLNDIPWSDGTNSGTFDLSLVATSSVAGIRRGGKGAFGAADGPEANGLLKPGDIITLGSLAASDLQGYLADKAIGNIQLIAVYLGNETEGDSATINGLVANGDAGGDTNEVMRNDIDAAATAVIEGAGSIAVDGYSVNGIAITFEVGPSYAVDFESCGLNSTGGFEVTFSGLSTELSYELRHAADLESDFELVPGTSKVPSASTDSFVDPSPTLPGKGFYRLYLSPEG